MIPKIAIERAIEGGWKENENSWYESGLWECIALDPTFWQALGRALGWLPKAQSYIPQGHTTNWYYEARRFYNLILTGGDVEKFWADLLANHN